MTYMPKRIQQLDDLEQYELIVAAYPEKFGEREETDDLWEDVQNFMWDICESGESDRVIDLLSRIVYLTAPMGSALTGAARHAIGKPERLSDGSFGMCSAVSRACELEGVKQ